MSAREDVFTHHSTSIGHRSGKLGYAIVVQRDDDGVMRLRVQGPADGYEADAQDRIDLAALCLADVLSWEMVDAIRRTVEQGEDYQPHRDDPLALQAAALLSSLLPPRGPQ